MSIWLNPGLRRTRGGPTGAALVDCQPIDVPSFLERAGFEIVASEGVPIWGLPVLPVVSRHPDSG